MISKPLRICSLLVVSVNSLAPLVTVFDNDPRFPHTNHMKKEVDQMVADAVWQDKVAESAREASKVATSTREEIDKIISPISMELEHHASPAPPAATELSK